MYAYTFGLWAAQYSTLQLKYAMSRVNHCLGRYWSQVIHLSDSRLVLYTAYSRFHLLIQLLWTILVNRSVCVVSHSIYQFQLVHSRPVRIR